MDLLSNTRVPDSPSRPARASPRTDGAPLKQTPSTAGLNLGDAATDATRAGTAARRALGASGCPSRGKRTRHAPTESYRARWRVSPVKCERETDAAVVALHSPSARRPCAARVAMVGLATFMIVSKEDVPQYECDFGRSGAQAAGGAPGGKKEDARAYISS